MTNKELMAKIREAEEAEAHAMALQANAYMAQLPGSRVEISIADVERILRECPETGDQQKDQQKVRSRLSDLISARTAKE
jgi:hypothetical protein